ncbi:MAG: type II secretion system protein [Tissierellia bacterium]|nr:type II secretion system protein [Tissierellia bacterium]
MKKGFTLIELLLVITIIGILSGIALIRIGGMNHYREKMEIKGLVKELHTMRNTAIHKNRRIYFNAIGEKDFIITDRRDYRREHHLMNLKFSRKDFHFYFTSLGAPEEGFTMVLRGKRRYKIIVPAALGKIQWIVE